MVDTIRSLSVLQTLLADNTTGEISPQDIRDFLVSAFGYADPLAFKPGSPNTPDSAWESGLGNYTAVSGSSGTATLLTAGTTVTTIYDLTSKPGWMLVNVGDGDQVSFRCDYTLPDNRSMVLAISGSPQAQAGDNMNISLRLNNNDAGSTSGDYVACMLEQDTTEYVVQANTSADVSGTELTQRSFMLAERVYLRIARATLTYHCFASKDGWAWTWVDSFTFASALDNVWLSVAGASTADRAHLAAIPWIREGSNDPFPW